MPITKSAKKRVRQAAKSHSRNLVYKLKVKQLAKKVKKDPVAFVEAVSAIDKAVSKKVLHRNTAARLKSQLSKVSQQQVKS